MVCLHSNRTVIRHHVNLGVVTHICNPSDDEVRWEETAGESQKLWASQLGRKSSKQRVIVSNKVGDGVIPDPAL